MSLVWRGFLKMPLVARSRAVFNLWEEQGYWGRNVYFSDFEKLRLTGHHPQWWDWDVGCEVRVRMVSGNVARFRVVEFERARGVSDLFFASVKFVAYLKS